MNIPAKQRSASTVENKIRTDGERRVMVSGINNDSRYMMAVLLGMWGYEVIEAAGEDETLERAEAERPQLILVDASRPFEEDLQVVSRLRQSSLPKDLPVIVMSGHTQETHHRLAFEHGATGVLVKPLDLELLEDYLETFLPGDGLNS
jgi:CheY-like chemotaxis protein